MAAVKLPAKPPVPPLPEKPPVPPLPEKPPVPPLPEKPPVPPLEDIAKGLARLVARRHRGLDRMARHTPLDRGIKQAGALSQQRQVQRTQAAQTQAAKTSAQAQRAKATSDLAEALAKTKPKPATATEPKTQEEPKEEKQEEKQEAPAPTPPKPAPSPTPPRPASPQPRPLGATGPIVPGRQPMQPAQAKPAGQATGPLIPQAPAPAPIPMRPRGGIGPYRKQPRRLGQVLAQPANTPKKPKGPRPGALGGVAQVPGAQPMQPTPVEHATPTPEQLRTEAGITPGEGLKPVPPLPRGNTGGDTGRTHTQAAPFVPEQSAPKRRKKSARDTISDQPTVLAPMPEPPKPEPTPTPAPEPVRGEPTPVRGRFDQLWGLLREHNWHGFNRTAEGRVFPPSIHKTAADARQAYHEEEMRRLRAAIEQERRDQEEKGKKP